MAQQNYAGILERQLTLQFSSDPAVNNGVQPTNDGSTFSVAFDTPLILPRAALDASIEVIQSSIWWVVPNIKAGINDRISFTVAAVPYTITYPPGLYSLDQLTSTTKSLLGNIPGMDPLAFSFSANTAAQLVVVTFSIAAVQIDFNAAQSPSVILGFTGLVPAAPSLAGQSVDATAIAQFNSISGFQIRSNMIQQGISTNSGASGVLANVPIVVSPGSQNIFQPMFPQRCPFRNAIGTQIGSPVTFTLTDQNGGKVDTNGEYWSFVAIVRYWTRE